MIVVALVGTHTGAGELLDEGGLGNFHSKDLNVSSFLAEEGDRTGGVVVAGGGGLVCEVVAVKHLKMLVLYFPSIGAP